MSREIKFRAWDGHRIRHDVAILFAGKAHVWDEEDETIDTKDWPLMQFTGLKDRHGKEIYEGDVLKSGDEQRVIRNFIEDTYWLRVDDRQGQVFEIIGNIYENPELIK